MHGVIAHDTGMIDAPIARAEKERTRMAVRDTPSAREAITTFRVLERFEHGGRDDGYTLIDCKLFTGRTHQIRVHLEYAKHPLVGDPAYTSGAPSAPAADLGLDRQFLHSDVYKRQIMSSTRLQLESVTISKFIGIRRVLP